MNTMLAPLLIGLMLTVCDSIVYAGLYEDGVAAVERQDYATALRLLRPLADQGSAPAQLVLGILYNSGNGVAQNAAEAAKWFRLSADQGDAEAKAELGNIFYYGGTGVTKDHKEAAKWYHLAADQGVADAQVHLGHMCEHGDGVTQDYREARKWYRLAADQGDAEAEFFLGNIFHDGKGTIQDYKEGAKWHRLAAQQGMAKAQLSLCIQYYGGKEGVPQYYIYSYMWCSLAASNLDSVLGEAATRERNAAANELTHAQLLTTQQLTKRREETNYKQCDKTDDTQAAASLISVPMQKEGGIYVVPVIINDAITLHFVVDSGASDVSIPADVVTTLMRTGTLKQSDFLGQTTYLLAVGSKVPSQTFRFRSLKVGGKVVENVNGSIASEKGGLLLGQSFLNRFKLWSIDNDTHALVLE